LDGPTQPPTTHTDTSKLHQHNCATYVVHVWLPQQILEEGIGVAQASAADDVLICDKAIAPVEPKHILAGPLKEEQHSIWRQLPQCVCCPQVQLMRAGFVAVGLPLDLHGVGLVHDIDEDTACQVTLEVGEAGHLQEEQDMAMERHTVKE
jgi:hypothetical protein